MVLSQALYDDAHEAHDPNNLHSSWMKTQNCAPKSKESSRKLNTEPQHHMKTQNQIQRLRTQRKIVKHMELK
jgi:hypothetical protein